MVYSHLDRKDVEGSSNLLLKIIKDWLNCKSFIYK
jgi:hypothetical protein